VKTYPELLPDPPHAVAWSEVVDDDPPSRDETLAWLWFIRPDLGSEIASDASSDLHELIEHFQTGHMETWWRRFMKEI